MRKVAQVTFDGSEAADLTAWQPPCVERIIPGLGSTWVHGYSGADVGRWKRLAGNICSQLPDAAVNGEATEECLRICQSLIVCRQAAGSDELTFKVELGGVVQAFRTFRELLPGLWCEEVCRESDWLTMLGYRRTEGDGRAPEQIERSLNEALADPEFWTSLDYLSRQLFAGLGIAENGVPLAEVLSLLTYDIELRSKLLGVMGSIGGLT